MSYGLNASDDFPQQQPRTDVVITMDSGTQHKGFVTELDLKKLRDALDGKPSEGSISVTLYEDAKNDENTNLQLAATKVESVAT